MYKVLIADDEEWIVENLRLGFPWMQYGFEVVETALDGIEALEKIEKLCPDLVLTDIRMPGLNGLELIKRVCRAHPRIQFVVISGFAEFAYAQKALNYGVLGYCLKPLEDADISMMLNKASLNLDRQDKEKAMEEKLEELNKGREQYEAGLIPEEVGNDTASALVKYVNENYCSNLTLQELALRFHIHAGYVSQLFKKETGKNFLEFLTSARMDYACRLLRESKLSVNHVAEKCGYDDTLYFRRIFKKHVGKTPSEYREV